MTASCLVFSNTRELATRINGAFATASITVVAPGSIPNGSYVTITDPNAGVLTFYFDKSGFVPGGGYGDPLFRVDITAAVTVNDVAQALVAAILAAGYLTLVSAGSDPSDGLVLMTSPFHARANLAIQKSVDLSAGFVVSGFSGGINNIVRNAIFSLTPRDGLWYLIFAE